MRKRRYDRVSRMERERRRRVRRRVMKWAKWAIVILGAAAFALALTEKAAGKFTRADTLTVFMISVLFWMWLEAEIRLLSDHIRERMRAITRERVQARRSGRTPGAEQAKEIIKLKG